MKLLSAKQSANLLLSILKLYAIMACVNAQAITFNELLAQANLWQPQRCHPREDLIVKEVSSVTKDSITTRVTLRPTDRPNYQIAKIAYIRQQSTSPVSHFITTLKVDPDYRRIGIASMLLGATLHTLRDAGYSEAALSAQPLDDDAFWTTSYRSHLGTLVKLYEHNGGKQAQVVKLPTSLGFREYPYSVLMVFDLTRDPR